LADNCSWARAVNDGDDIEVSGSPDWDDDNICRDESETTRWCLQTVYRPRRA